MRQTNQEIVMPVGNVAVKKNVSEKESGKSITEGTVLNCITIPFTLK